MVVGVGVGEDGGGGGYVSLYLGWNNGWRGGYIDDQTFRNADKNPNFQSCFF